ncbi:MAG: universal stress protein [Ignavibacteriales bacterium]|nr:universal stress protein [Ignavibacteriales bacterium]
MKLPKKILVPTDMSTYSLSALQYAEIVAEVFGAEITLIHIVPGGEKSPDVRKGSKASSGEAVSIEESKKMLSHLLMDKDLIIRSIKILVRNGSAAEEIVKAAREMDADLIVMSTHGRTGVRRTVIGSVAERVVRYALCPVLTVKPEEFRELVSLSEEEVAKDLHMN